MLHNVAHIKALSLQFWHGINSSQLAGVDACQAAHIDLCTVLCLGNSLKHELGGREATDM